MLGLKIYQAETDIHATFMHPYKSCIKYTNPFIRVLGGTHLLCNASYAVA